MVPQYEILCLLGRGGMGAVYQGRQISLDRLVAIKILSNDLEEADANFAERFKNEARAMAKLTHPGIVSVYDFGETPSGLLYIVMEFVEGTDVQKMISTSRRLHTEHAMAITAHVCDALAYAHERGIIHRDIKPANIMVGYDGSVKVADFGLAKVSTGGQTVGLTQSGIAMGTLHFMAPEALMLGTAVDHRADIYAVGVMLYQMLTGKLPQGMFELPSIQVQGLDPRYDGIIAKALREDREVRYQSAKAMRQDLDAILTQPVVKLEPAPAGAVQQPAVAALPTQARPKRPTGQPYRPPQSPSAAAYSAPKKSSAGLWVMVLLLLFGASAAWFFIQKPQESTSPLIAVSASDSSKKSIITLRTPDATRVLPLEVGQPRLYDSSPLRVIEVIDPALAGWQFTSIPQRIDNEYEVSISQSGTLYAFGGRHKDATVEDIFGKDAPQWQTDEKAIKGSNIKMCYRREVKAGEVIRLKAFELQLAAQKIILEKAAISAAPAIPPVLEKLMPKTEVTAAVPPVKSVPLPAASGDYRKLDDAFIQTSVRGSTWRTQYSDDWYEDTLVFAPSGNTAEKSPSTRYHQSASWDVQADGITLRVVMSGASGFYMLLRFKDGISGDAEFHRGSAPVLVGKIKRDSVIQQPAGTGTASSVKLGPLATETNWIDAKGRSLQAKFVRVEGGSVLLDIAGKRTPVPLVTLSEASQQIAQDLQSAVRPLVTQGQDNSLENSILGLWEQRNDGSNFFNYIAFFEDGSAGFSWMKRGMGIDGHWKIAGNELRVTWRSGCVYTIDLKKGTSNQRKGTAVGGTPSFFTLEIKHTGLRPSEIMPTMEELEDTSFDFSFKAGTRIDSNGILSLLKGGGVVQQSPMNITGWKLFNGYLMLMDSRHECQTLLSDFEKKNGKWSIRGQFIPVAPVEHRLEQRIENGTSGVSSSASWTPLFPNDSLELWKGDTSAYSVRNGILTAGVGDLISKKEYASFHLKFELRLSSGGNNGIGIWCADTKGPWPFIGHTGFEIQILDDEGLSFVKAGNPWQLHGALTYFIIPKAKPIGPLGSWTQHEIRLQGTHLTEIINGTTVIDQELPTGAPIGGSRKHPLDLSRKRGHLIFMGMKGPVEFRDVMIKELP
jgi:serine/threonine protein kinase